MKEAPEPLRRELSRFAIGLLAINGIIGAGIFGLPAKTAALAGAFSPMIFVLCGVLTSALVLCFAEASSYFRSTGGPIVYTRAAFGPFAGFETGWMIYVGRVTSIAANVNLLATYGAGFAPGLDTGWRRIAVVVAVMALFTLLNVMGVREGMRSVLAISVLKAVPLLAFVLVGLAFVRAEPFAAAAVPSYHDLGASVILVFYAFIGFEGALVPAGEARSPRRDMPRALVAVALAATVLYVAIQTISVAVLPTLATSKRPLADAAGAMVGAVGVVAITLGAAVSILGNIGASFLSAPRMTYALAREHAFPAWFATVHERYRTPHRSVLFYCAIAFILAVTGTFESLAEMSSLARIVGYVLSVAALPRLRRRFGADPTAFRLPFGWTIPAIALVVCAWLATQVSPRAMIGALAFAAAGAALYLVASRARRGDPTPNEVTDHAL